MLFGGNDVSRWFTDHAGRPIKFARYTGRTLYRGRRRADTSKHWAKLKEPLEFFTKLEDSAAVDLAARDLIAELPGAEASGPPSHLLALTRRMALALG